MDRIQGPAVSEMCAYCFDALQNHFDPSYSIPSPSFPDAEFPLFVTWKIGQTKELRGCIGCFNAKPLHRGLKEFALISSLNDDRFDPVTPAEIPHLHCSVSLLHSFEPCPTWDAWVVGTHGINIDIGRYGATYLPEVAAEQRWNHIQTLNSLLRKAGYRRSLQSALEEGMKIKRYQSAKVHMAYGEYEILRRRRR